MVLGPRTINIIVGGDTSIKIGLKQIPSFTIHIEKDITSRAEISIKTTIVEGITERT